MIGEEGLVGPFDQSAREIRTPNAVLSAEHGQTCAGSSSRSGSSSSVMDKSASAKKEIGEGGRVSVPIAVFSSV